MSVQPGAALRLDYGLQGAHQSGATLVLSNASLNPGRTRVTASTVAHWTAGVKSHRDTRAPMATTLSSDPRARAPWIRGVHRSAQSSATWGVSSRRDTDSVAPWGQFGALLAASSLSNWLVAQHLDDGRTAPWGQYATRAGVEPLATWVVSDKRDVERTTPWGRYVLVDLVSAPGWPGSKPGDAERYNPWIKFSRQLSPGWGVVTPPGDPDGTEALFYILPARFYMAVHTVYAQRLPDLAEVPLFDATVAADSGSYCWTLQASGPASLFELLPKVNGLPAQIRLTMDGIPWVFAVDGISRKGAFAKSDVTVRGRSVTALIAAPYLRATTRTNSTDRTAQQLALEALSDTGIDLDWGVGEGALANGGLVDWLVPAGAWSHKGTPLDAVQAIVQASGGYLQSHRSAATLLARHPYGTRLGDNPGAPWGWMNGAADVELATDALITDDVSSEDGPDINAVYVSGTSAGVLALVKRTGTAADKLSDMVTDALITHTAAARQRGLSILGAAGHKYSVSLDLPVLTGAGQPGVLDVGQLVQVNTATPWRGRVRGVSVQSKMPTLRQTVTLDRHLETS